MNECTTEHYIHTRQNRKDDLQNSKILVQDLTDETRRTVEMLLELAERKYETEKLGTWFNPLNPELNPICYLLALLGAHHFLHVSRIRVKLLAFRLLMLYIRYIYNVIYTIYIYIYTIYILYIRYIYYIYTIYIYIYTIYIYYIYDLSRRAAGPLAC